MTSGRAQPVTHLGQPVAVEDGSGQGFVTVDVGKVFEGDRVDVLIGPASLLVLHQSAGRSHKNQHIQLCCGCTFWKQRVTK